MKTRIIKLNEEDEDEEDEDEEWMKEDEEWLMEECTPYAIKGCVHLVYTILWAYSISFLSVFHVFYNING